MKISQLLTLCACTLMFGSWGCKDDISDGNLDEIVFPATNVSYGRHVEPLFARGCAFAGCHSQDSQAGSVILDNYQDALTHKTGTIIPGDTANSTLVWSIEGRVGRIRMPLNRPPLNANQINGIKQWILEGAQNN